MKKLALPDVGDIVGAGVPGRSWLDEEVLRRRAGDSLGSGLTRELWKYTPIKGFLDELAGSTPATTLPSLGNADQAGVTAVAFDDLEPAQEARLRRAVAEHVDGGRHPMADLSLLRARGGWLVEVEGSVEHPLEIRYPGRGVAPVFVLLAPQASLTLIEHLDTHAFLAQVTHVDLATGARVEHHRSALDENVPHYSLLNVRLGRDAGYTLTQSCMGGARRRIEVHVVLDGPGTRADLTGAYLVGAGQHLDQQLLVEHRQGNSVSRQKFHGIGAGKGRSVFNGRIHIHPHAPSSDAALTNKNLALHPEAEMNTKPELEIYTDDVRCAHGATVGRVPDDALFYLTARGITEADARRLLAYGFVRECMDGPLAEAAAARFREALS